MTMKRNWLVLFRLMGFIGMSQLRTMLSISKKGSLSQLSWVGWRGISQLRKYELQAKERKKELTERVLSCLVGWELSSWGWGGRVSVHYLRLTSTCHTRHNLIHPPFCQYHIMILKELRGKKTRTIVGRFITLAPVTIPFLLEHQSSELASNAPTVLWGI